MSSEKTENLQLNKWGPTDYVKADEFNENFDKIDSRIANNENEIGNLSNNIDSIQNEVDSHSQKIYLTDFIEYGKINLPSDFPKTLPFDIYRDFDGVVKHNFDFQILKSGYPNVYVKRNGGSETNDGLSPATPVKSLTKALQIANAQSSGTVNIVFMDKFVSYILNNPADDIQTYTLNKNINILSNNIEGTFIISGYDPYTFTWTLENGLYKTNRSQVQKVFDYKYKDFLGLPRELAQKSSLTEVQNTPGSWYTDGTYVWINRLDGSQPDDNVALLLPIDTYFGFTLNGFRLYIENVHFWIKQNIKDYNALYVAGNQNSSFFSYNSSFRFARGNGFAGSCIGGAHLFECFASDNGYDGFNYHGNGGANPYEFVFEYRCYSYGNGAVINNGTGNATTAHDGMTILRIGSVGHDCVGPVLADVNGCYSVNIDCVMYNSLRSSGSTKAAFYFDETSAAKQGKAYLTNCGGGGADYSISSDGNVDIYVRNFKGQNINSNTMLNFF